jgi:cell division septal protein FtsQ
MNKAQFDLRLLANYRLMIKIKEEAKTWGIFLHRRHVTLYSFSLLLGVVFFFIYIQLNSTL